MKYLVFVSVLILLGLLALSIKTNLRIYREYIADKLNPVNQQPIDSVKNKILTNTNAHRKTVIIFGSSSAKFWTMPETDSIEFINLGVSGETSYETLLRAKALIPYLKPDYLLLQTGSNDAKAVAVLPHKYQKIVDDYYSNINEIIQVCKNSGTKVILSTLFPKPKIPLLRRLAWNEQSNETVLLFNTFLKNKKQHPDVYVFDSYQHLINNHNQLTKEYKKDFMHINDHAYSVLNQHLMKYFISEKNGN